jgi:FMN phosphatase YigB (HAD superfamily)
VTATFQPHDPAPGDAGTVFLLDVDNTLLDNDRFGDDLSVRLERDFGRAECERYWAIYDRLREALGYADYLAALQEFRDGLDDDPDLLGMSAFLLEYPFAERVYPHAPDAIAHLDTLGRTVILSDGDVVFQPRKVQRSGLWDALGGRVLIYLHKQHMLASVQRRHPADHYVMVDDKPGLLAQMKQILGARLTTVFVRQGHYAAAAGDDVIAAADICIDRIGDLCRLGAADFLPAAAPRFALVDRP